MGTHHFPSHASSVSLGALGQHPQPGLLERHFFALTLGDSSKEAQRGCKEGLSFQTGAGHPAPTSLWWCRCKIFILLSYCSLISSGCSFCVSISHLPNSVARFLHLVCLWKNSFILLPCSNCSPGTLLFHLSHIVLFHFLLLDTASALCSPLVFVATINSLLPAREGSFWILCSLFWYSACPEHPTGQTVSLPSASIQIESCPNSVKDKIFSFMEFHKG